VNLFQLVFRPSLNLVEVATAMIWYGATVKPDDPSVHCHSWNLGPCDLYTGEKRRFSEWLRLGERQRREGLPSEASSDAMLAIEKKPVVTPVRSPFLTIG
jgi:hypothetical protein